MILESGLELAYIGDAVYELMIREYLLNKGLTSVKNLHKEAVNFTQALSQSYIVEKLMDFLTEEEIEYYKRGRNSGGTHKPKNASLNDYRRATGFESLIGFLYLSKNKERLDEIVSKAIELIQSKE